MYIVCMYFFLCVSGNTKLVSLSGAVKLAAVSNIQIPGTVIQTIRKYCKVRRRRVGLSMQQNLGNVVPLPRNRWSQLLPQLVLLPLLIPLLHSSHNLSPTTLQHPLPNPHTTHSHTHTHRHMMCLVLQLEARLFPSLPVSLPRQ